MHSPRIATTHWRGRGQSPGAQETAASWRERVAALRYAPALLKLVFETEPRYTVGIILLRVVRSFVPVAQLWIGKLIIDGVVAGIAAMASGAPVAWRYLAMLVALELLITVGGETLARLSALLESLLGDLFSNNVSVRLMQHASTHVLRNEARKRPCLVK